MTRRIGIVGCLVEGATTCCRTIRAQGAAGMDAHVHPDVPIHTPSLADYVECLARSDLDGVGKLMLDSARTLATGAHVPIRADNVIHPAFKWFAARSSWPCPHIADVVAERSRHKRISLHGTDRHALAAGSAHDVRCIRTKADERDEIGRILMDELLRGRFLPSGIATFQAVIRRFARGGPRVDSDFRSHHAIQKGCR